MVFFTSPGRAALLAFSVVPNLVPQVEAQWPTLETETQSFLARSVSGLGDLIPTPWMCNQSPWFWPDPGTQSVLQFHANWHCTYRDWHPEFGRRFFGFHKQFLLAYNFHLASLGLPNAPTFRPSPNAKIPPRHVDRPRDAPCGTCTTLSSMFEASGSLGSITSVQSLGTSIVDWHNNNHGYIAASGPSGGCGDWTTPGTKDMNCPRTSPRDPIFYQYHSIFDDVQNAWHSLQPADVAIVMDRSGSMSSNLAVGTTRLQAAKDAAQMFGDMVDVTSSHRLGLVSFSNTASTNLALTPAATFSSALSGAMGSVSASGSTSIGAGLNAGQALVSAGGEPRKGIVLLTDGQENVAPWIRDANLGDTHLCAVGFANPSLLNGGRLSNLAEKQGGIWTSTEDPVQLKKVFVQCFANIFDATQAIDPLDTLSFSTPLSPPTVHTAMGDGAIVFVLGWADPKVKMQLAITSPSGAVVSLNDTGVQSKVGSTWHVLRVKLPYKGEQDGDWTSRAVLQPVRGYVIGVSSLAVGDISAAGDMVRSQIATLCAANCTNALFYQDQTNATSTTFQGPTSFYHEAVLSEAGRGTIRNVTIAPDAKSFADLLTRNKYDLVVYNAPAPNGLQPYDDILAKIICANATKYIISDTRGVSKADAILKCAGIARSEIPTTEGGHLIPSNSSLIPDKLPLVAPVVKGAKSYALTGGSVQASYVLSGGNYGGGGSGPGAVVAIAGPGGNGSVDYFISVLAKSPLVKLKPKSYANNTYVGDELHPLFHVPAPYWPSCGFAEVNGTVTVTRPLAGLYSGGYGDTSADNAKAPAIPTETKTYPLRASNGTGIFDAAIKDITKYDGEYKLHARLTLCNVKPCGKRVCIVREAESTIIVQAKLAKRHTGVEVREVKSLFGRGINGSTRVAHVVITPRDAGGEAMGRGQAGHLVARGLCGAHVESLEEVVEVEKGLEGHARYRIKVKWSDKKQGDEAGCKRPGVSVHSFGRPREAMMIDL